MPQACRCGSPGRAFIIQCGISTEQKKQSDYAPAGRSDASPDEREAGTVFRKIAEITGQHFRYPNLFVGRDNVTGIF
jgi:hypothetical protein